MSKFSINNLIFYNVIILLCASVINTEDIEDVIDPSSSLESMSKEIYNFTSKEKPVKRIIENIPDSTSENNLIDLEDNFNSKNIFPENNSSDNELELPIESLSLQSKPMIVAATYSDFPFTVSIQKRGSHYASGAFIHKMWILSVAELFYNVRESIKLYKARLGSINSKKGGILLYLKGIEIHPQYEYGLPHFDLALLRIANPVTVVTQTVAPARLPKLEEDDLNTMYWSTYWPRLIVQSNVLSSLANERYEQNIMRISYQQSITWNNCKDVLKKINVALDNSSICLEPITSHHSRCLPDPGAPVVADNYLWGITSGWTSKNCFKRRSPTLVTAVSSLPVISWIYHFLDMSKTSDEKNSIQ